jgi:RimJ/RimL family protein N-acetyltransferase
MDPGAGYVRPWPEDASSDAAPKVKAPANLVTNTLVLRKPAPQDAVAIFTQYAGDPVVTRYLSWPRHRTIQETRAFLELSEAAWRHWPAGPYLIESNDGALLGATGLSFQTPDHAAVGYVLARNAWGRGIATEALRAVIAVGAAVGVRRLCAVCHTEHAASLRVLEKCGFTRDGVLREHREFPNLQQGKLSDVFSYSLVLGGDPCQ